MPVRPGLVNGDDDALIELLVSALVDEAAFLGSLELRGTEFLFQAAIDVAELEMGEHFHAAEATLFQVVEAGPAALASA